MFIIICMKYLNILFTLDFEVCELVLFVTVELLGPNI